MKVTLRLAPLLLLVASCGKFDPNLSSSSSVTGVIVPQGQAFALGDPGPQNANLASTTEISVLISAAGDFSGDVDLSIERTELDAVDTRGAVIITAVPNRISLNPGETKVLSVHVVAQSMAPDFNDHFHLVAKESMAVGTPREATVPISFRINPLIEIDLHGGPTPEVFIPTFSSISIGPHAGGVTVRFVNLDRAAAHIIHGQGAVPHQNTSMPMEAATAAAPGGSYEFKVTNTTPNLSGQFYCHNHESGGQARTMIFNVP